jgi:hypothetical protein
MLETTRLEDLQEQFKDALIQANSPYLPINILILMIGQNSMSPVKICRLQ